MLREFCGKLNCENSFLNLTLTLLGGQSFRWKNISIKEKQQQFLGVFSQSLWLLEQPTKNTLSYKVFYNSDQILDKEYFDNILIAYFRLDFDLELNFEYWKNCHAHFKETATQIEAVRVLDQDVFENIVSFICSQNNNITRISYMVEWFCTKYGKKICKYEEKDYYSFPVLDTFKDISKIKMEADLRENKFGYRSKMIVGAIRKINKNGGWIWLQSLKTMKYESAREELQNIPGIGPKVADCICLMSLNHLEAVPVDRHMYNIAKQYYMPHLNIKTLTPRWYENIAEMYRSTYGVYSGWAQAVLFCSKLKKFKNIKND